jgi:hypothetical protein
MATTSTTTLRWTQLSCDKTVKCRSRSITTYGGVRVRGARVGRTTLPRSITRTSSPRRGDAIVLARTANPLRASVTVNSSIVSNRSHPQRSALQFYLAFRTRRSRKGTAVSSKVPSSQATRRRHFHRAPRAPILCSGHTSLYSYLSLVMCDQPSHFDKAF